MHALQTTPRPPSTTANRLRRLKRQQWLLGLACTLLVMVAWRAGILNRLELPTLDWRTRMFNIWAGGPSPDVVVMGIDDEAVREAGDWPWSRAIIGEAIAELHDAGARTIALDVLYDSPWTRAPMEDAALAAAIAAHAGVVLPFRSSDAPPAAPSVPSPLDLVRDPASRDVLARFPDHVAAGIIAQKIAAAPAAPSDSPAPSTDVIAPLLPTARLIISTAERSSVPLDDSADWSVPIIATYANFPIPPLTDAAAALGDVAIQKRIAFDADNVYRRFPLWTNLGDYRLWPSFSLAAVSHFLECPVPDLFPRSGSIIEIPGNPARRVRTTSMTTSAGRYPFIHVLTWPRGGSSWQGQFNDPRAATPREVSISAALRPFLIRRDTTENIDTLQALLQLAHRLNLGDYTSAVELARQLRDTPVADDAWAALLERVETESSRAAAEAADFLDFAGPVDLATLRPEDARTYIDHREVADKIPLILAECRSVREATDSARVRLRDIVSNRLVFVGWTATGVVADSVNTTLGARTPGVYIHAAAASSFLTGFVRQPVPAIADAAFILLLGIGGIAAARRASVWLAPLLITALIAAWALLAGVVLWDASWRTAAIAAPAIAAFTAWLSVLLHRLLVEQRMRRRTEERFRAYVSPAVVDELVNNPQLDSMTPQRRELTIMFCDVTGFTAIAERLGAEGTARFLTGYLGRMTDTLLRHNATIDKYLGDGIMAFWGAPIHDPRHARNACRGAISLARAVAQFGLRDASPPNADSPGPLHIRIGLAAGDVMVGDFGNPPIRSSYTVLGDACNIAARLERACKLLGTTVLVSAGVRAGAGEGFLWRPLGRFVLHGRLAPEPIFELLGMTAPGAKQGPDDLLTLSNAPGRSLRDPASLDAWIRATEEAVAAFAAARWDEARDLFERLARDFSDETFARVYLDAIARRAAGEPLSEPVDAIPLSES